MNEDKIKILVKGLKGDKGEQGPQGIQGVQGIQGEQGPQGVQGLQGERGLDGVDGRDGRDGIDGKDGADGKDAQVDLASLSMRVLEAIRQEKQIEAKDIKDLEKIPELVVELQQKVAYYMGGNTGTNTVKISATDTNADFLLNKLTAGSNISLTRTNAGGDEKITISSTAAPSPLTTKGDLFGFSTVDARIPVGTNNQVLTADSTQSLGVKWATVAGGISLFDTEKNILATTPSTSGSLAYATDLSQVMLWNGSAWIVLSAYGDTDASGFDMGWLQGSNRAGYARTYVTDKELANTWLGYSVLTTTGGLRLNPRSGAAGSVDAIQAYITDSISTGWKTVTVGFEFREVNGVLQTRPQGYTKFYDVYSGNSSDLGLNGLPLVSNYKASMGAWGVEALVGGYTF